jgi:hypothetical protein
MRLIQLKSDQRDLRNCRDEKATLDNIEIDLARRQKLYSMVHPEVQITTYSVKEDSLRNAPGYISSSKSACFSSLFRRGDSRL